MTQEEVEKLPSYRLLKDLPLDKAGTVFRPYRFNEESRQVQYTPEAKWTPSFNKGTIESKYEWFEKIEPNFPSSGDRYFSIDTGDSAKVGTTERYWIGGYADKTRLEIGNMFRTLEEAKAARDRVVALLGKIRKENEAK